MYLNIEQIREEAEDEVALEEKGWQEALTEVIPLQINVLEVVEARSLISTAATGR